MSGSPVQLPPELSSKIDPWPEFRMGVHRVVAVLRDGTIIRDVFVSGGLVRGVGQTGTGTGPIPFSADEIVDVENQAD